MYNWIQTHSVLLGLVFGAVGAIAAVVTLFSEPRDSQPIVTTIDNRDQSKVEVDNSQSTSIGDVNIFTGDKTPSKSGQSMITEEDQTSNENISSKLGNEIPSIEGSGVFSTQQPRLTDDSGQEYSVPAGQNISKTDVVEYAESSEKHEVFPILEDQMIRAEQYPPLEQVTHTPSLLSIAEVNSHAFSLRVECIKEDDGGCTAHARVCANSPEGRFYVAGESISGSDSGSLSPGHTPVCGIATTGAEGAPINGMLAPSTMCANLHAESGSGTSNIGKVFFTRCDYTAKTLPLPDTDSTDIQALLRFSSEAEQHVFVLRNDCRKTSENGCTAVGRVCAHAPEGRYFVARELTSGADTGSLSPGHTPVCGIATTGGDGTPIKSMLAPSTMCANLHAESGSGPTDIGKVFFARCEYTATTLPLPY